MRTIRPLFVAFSLLAQQSPPAPESGSVKFTSNTQLVVEMVTVKGKDGKAIEGLTAKDFTITEDGKPQVIRFCEFQRLEENPGAVTAIPATAPNPGNASQVAIAPEKPGDLRYRNRRLLILYFDQSKTPRHHQLRALDAAVGFIRRQMAAADVVAILAYSHGMVRVHRDFTDDRTALIATLTELSVTVNNASLGMGDDDSGSDLGSAFGQDYGEFNIFNTDRQLAALQTAAKMLGTLNEKKSLIYFASGLKLNGMDNQAQLRATVNAAMRANVALFTVDARGLVAQAPLGDATLGSPGGNAMYTGAAASAGRTVWRNRRIRSGPWPPIPAARRCWTTTTSPWESSRRRRRSPATTSSATTPATKHSTASSAKSRSRSTRSWMRDWNTAAAIGRASGLRSSLRRIKSGSSKRR